MSASVGDANVCEFLLQREADIESPGEVSWPCIHIYIYIYIN